jgi:hypothetical protein
MGRVKNNTWLREISFCRGRSCLILCWKQHFIKNYMSGDVDPIDGDIKTLIAFLVRTVAKENALLASKFKFMFCIGPLKRIAGTTKSSKEEVVWIFVKQL